MGIPSPGATLTSAAFTWCTVLAIVFGVLGWVQIWHIMLQIHKAARVGNMVRGDCKHSYMEYESPLRYVRALVNDKSYMKRLHDALNMLGRGTFFLFLSVVLGPAIATINCGRKSKTVDECADVKEGAHPKISLWGMIVWLCVLVYTGLMVSQGKAAPTFLGANIDDGTAYKKVIGIQTSLYISLFLIYAYPKYYAHEEFFERDGTFVADSLWLFIWFLMRTILLFGTHMFFKLDAFLKAYQLQIEATHTAIKELTHIKVAEDDNNKNAPLGKAFKALILQNMLRLPGLVKTRPDDAPSVMDAGTALEKMELPYFVFHEEGAELAVFAETVLEIPDMGWMKANMKSATGIMATTSYTDSSGVVHTIDADDDAKARENMTEKDYAKIVANRENPYNENNLEKPVTFDAKKAEWEKLDQVRDHMKALRDQNEAFSKAIGTLTAMISVGSCVAISIPAYVLYKKVAPALFGS
jgi:hypothetical protein